MRGESSSGVGAAVRAARGRGLAVGPWLRGLSVEVVSTLVDDREDAAQFGLGFAVGVCDEHGGDRI